MSRDALLAMLAEAAARRVLRPLDLAFARFIAECDPHAEAPLLLMAALASRQLGDGHPCLDLQALDTLALEQEWPDAWLALLSSTPSPTSPVMAGSDGLPADAPLVLDGHRLYLRRYWNYECRVAAGISARLDDNRLPAETLHDELQRLFPADAGAAITWPRVACALAARGAFSVITGGPGTGKTTTVVRLLGLLQTLQLRQHDAPLRIRLAAPTGKAAARLNASIARQIALLDVTEPVRQAIPLEVETLHRLLGARPDSRRYAHDSRHPLHVDVLVVDEASMIDLEMMAAVLDALPPHARLILIGDKDQLASVEAGAVLGELGQRAEQGCYTVATAQWLLAASSDDITAFVRDDAQSLDQRIAMLRSSHRFDAVSGIGQLAAAVNAGDAAAVNALLESPSPDMTWMASSVTATPIAPWVADRFAENEPQSFSFYLEQLRRHRPALDADDATYRQWAHDVLEAFNRFQVLCAVRQGPSGVEHLNRDIAAALQAKGLIEADRGWYEGRPVMMTRNDYSLGLMNGDVGITLRMHGIDGELRLYVAFPMSRATSSPASQNDGAQVRCVLPSRLGDVETVYAMTVHKSQGSEFEHTALVLPDDAPAVLTRELLYTGITRARRWLTLVGTQAAIEHALAQRTRRYSGLAERLAAS
ncbi:exodeoxyribonuclease V subunit alpha [Dyella nitratireducens]|uniref:RecBCD enzyme subunit RecD n=1 Tax=Dyella nitratireducens TaxID=1849580 RepID=A0ABQ1GNM4_9GAMM|nr:exodeoxyribonuclease V subunit alpha [Dyella nitratireducens]GGA47036.1 RecBCD enzyme subunit RecD [Dyella nitratireducens]GLQ41529.1 RecBCD enzyme subunit RecD [Dyella nitratireducens]